jgi:hypothetical protein
MAAPQATKVGRIATSTIAKPHVTHLLLLLLLLM